MLARRFTIVCLMTALFGMGFASLVARSDPSQRFQYGHQQTCSPNLLNACR